MRIARLACLLIAPVLLQLPAAFADETVVAHETDRYFIKDGRLMKLEPQYEYTYHLDLDKDILTRTRVFDFAQNKITPDETVYHIEKQLLSHPTNADRYILPPVVRGIGQPSADAIELVVIEGQAVQTVTSTANEIIFSRSKRLK